jgi:(3S)-malyl-CoA thioesterase
MAMKMAVAPMAVPPLMQPPYAVAGSVDQAYCAGMTRMLAPRTALFLPASRERAIEKARSLNVDMVVLDLEDAVAEAEKATAREAARAAVQFGFGGALVAVRVNAWDSVHQSDDLRALEGVGMDAVVVPKVESPEEVTQVARALGHPVLAMIETPRGVARASEIAEVDATHGLIAGVNDLRAALRLPSEDGREGLTLALQTIVLAARGAGKWALDGVYNGLENSELYRAECRQGRNWGFDGKTLIHPNQVAGACEAFGDSAEALAEARSLIAAFEGGAERFGDQMIESMHVQEARERLARASERAA